MLISASDSSMYSHITLHDTTKTDMHEVMIHRTWHEARKISFRRCLTTWCLSTLCLPLFLTRIRGESEKNHAMHTSRLQSDFTSNVARCCACAAHQGPCTQRKSNSDTSNISFNCSQCSCLGCSSDPNFLVACRVCQA